MRIDKLTKFWFKRPRLIRGISCIVLSLILGYAIFGELGSRFDAYLTSKGIQKLGWTYLGFFWFMIVFKLLSTIIKDRQQLKELAIRDELTGLYTRRFLYSEFGNLLTSKADRDHLYIFLLYIDLDNLKELNDSVSHLAGDIALRETAKIITSTVRENIVARIGGDEFIVTGTIDTEKNAEIMRERLENAFASAFFSYGTTLKLGLSASIGLCVAYPVMNDPLEHFLLEAEQDMYTRKNHKKTRQ